MIPFWARMTGLAAWVASCVAVIRIPDECLRGYTTFWAGACAIAAAYFVVGFFALSTGWKTEEGSNIIAMGAIIALVLGWVWVARVFLSPPAANPSPWGAIIFCSVFFVLLHRALIFTLRQVEARRELRAGK